MEQTNENLTKYWIDETYIRTFFENLILREKLEEIIAAEVPNVDTQLRARQYRRR